VSGRSARGASLNVQAALGWTGVAAAAPRTEVAPCLTCGAPLRFYLGEYGQTVEQCTRVGCPEAHPHHPRPDPAANKRKWERT